MNPAAQFYAVKQPAPQGEHQHHPSGPISAHVKQQGHQLKVKVEILKLADHSLKASVRKALGYLEM